MNKCPKRGKHGKKNIAWKSVPKRDALLKDVFKTERVGLGDFFRHFDKNLYLRQRVVVLFFVKIAERFVELIVHVFDAGMRNPDVQRTFCLLYTSPSPRD